MGSRRRKLLVAAVLGSSAALAAWSARRPRAKAPRPRPAPRPRRPPVDDVVPPQAKVHRWLVLAAILLAGAGLSVWSAHQERLGTGALISMLGFAAIGVVLWAVARRWGDWSPDVHFFQLPFVSLGLLCLAFSGPAVVTHLVLTHRGTLVDVEVAGVRAGDDGGGSYPLVVPRGSTPLRGELSTDLDLVQGEWFTAAVDPGRFVRPMLPEEVNPSPPAVFVLTGIGLLASCVLGFGFPLRTPRDTG